jgi:dephospho-CoA kinase
MSKPSQRNNHPFVVSLTGGIGAGKSLIAKFFAVLGVPVYDADHAAKEILAHDPDVVASVKDVFGPEAYAGGLPNRPYLASRVFEDSGLRTKLNAIVHPAVADDFAAWKEAQRLSVYVVKEAAISIETGIYKEADFVVLVTAPEALRVERVMKRNQISAAEVQKRLAAQWTDAEKKPFADFTIVNDGLSAIIPQTLHIHHTILKQVGDEKTNFGKNLE